jgi:hypothetical protein
MRQCVKIVTEIVGYDNSVYVHSVNTRVVRKITDQQYEVYLFRQAVYTQLFMCLCD